MSVAERKPPIVEQVVMSLEVVNGIVGLHDRAEAFDYACSKARAEAIDRMILDVVDQRGWTLFDEGVVTRVRVEHDGDTRARILVDGEPATEWWNDRVTRTETTISWSFEPAEKAP